MVRQAGPGPGHLTLLELEAAAGAIECSYYTEDNSAIAGYDYVEAC